MTQPNDRRASPGRLSAGVGFGIAASGAFSTSGVFARPLLDAGWTPGAAVFWRVLVASVVMLPVGAWLVRGRWRLVATQWRTILAFGALAVTVAQLLFFAAVERMDVGIALLLEYLAPVALVGLAWGRSRRSPGARVLAGVALSILGLLGVLDLTGATPDPLGVAYALVAMIGAASYFVLGARPSPLPPLALPAFGLPVGAALLGIASAVGILPYAAPLVDVAMFATLLPWWVPVGVIGLVAAGLAYCLGIAGMARMGERLGSFVSLTEVLFAVVLAALLLHQLPSLTQLLGGALIIAGVVVIRLAGDERATAPSGSHSDRETVSPPT